MMQPSEAEQAYFARGREVDEMAKELHRAAWSGRGANAQWDHETQDVKEQYRIVARAAIEWLEARGWRRDKEVADAAE